MKPIPTKLPLHLKRTKTSVASTLALLGCMILGGCVLPVPVNYHTRGSRTNVKPRATQWLVPGATTRHEAVLRLGEPDAVTEDDSRLTYRWEKVYLQLWVAMGAGYQGYLGRADYGRDHTLELTFDSGGRPERLPGPKR